MTAAQLEADARYCLTMAELARFIDPETHREWTKKYHAACTRLERARAVSSPVEGG